MIYYKLQMCGMQGVVKRIYNAYVVYSRRNLAAAAVFFGGRYLANWRTLVNQVADASYLSSGR